MATFFCPLPKAAVEERFNCCTLQQDQATLRRFLLLILILKSPKVWQYEHPIKLSKHLFSSPHWNHRFIGHTVLLYNHLFTPCRCVVSLNNITILLMYCNWPLLMLRPLVCLNRCILLPLKIFLGNLEWLVQKHQNLMSWEQGFPFSEPGKKKVKYQLITGTY